MKKPTKSKQNNMPMDSMLKKKHWIFQGIRMPTTELEMELSRRSSKSTARSWIRRWGPSIMLGNSRLSFTSITIGILTYLPQIKSHLKLTNYYHQSIPTMRWRWRNWWRQICSSWQRVAWDGRRRNFRVIRDYQK